MWISHSQSIFALQRLSAIQKELDLTEDTIEEDLLTRIRPKGQGEKVPAPESKDQQLEISEQALGVLQAFTGEIDDKRTR